MNEETPDFLPIDNMHTRRWLWVSRACGPITLLYAYKLQNVVAWVGDRDNLFLRLASLFLLLAVSLLGLIISLRTLEKVAEDRQSIFGAMNFILFVLLVVSFFETLYGLISLSNYVDMSTQLLVIICWYVQLICSGGILLWYGFCKHPRVT